MNVLFSHLLRVMASDPITPMLLTIVNNLTSQFMGVMLSNPITFILLTIVNILTSRIMDVMDYNNFQIASNCEQSDLAGFVRSGFLLFLDC